MLKSISNLLGKRTDFGAKSPQSSWWPKQIPNSGTLQFLWRLQLLRIWLYQKLGLILAADPLITTESVSLVNLINLRDIAKIDHYAFTELAYCRKQILVYLVGKKTINKQRFLVIPSPTSLLISTFCTWRHRILQSRCQRSRASFWGVPCARQLLFDLCFWLK